MLSCVHAFVLLLHASFSRLNVLMAVLSSLARRHISAVAVPVRSSASSAAFSASSRAKAVAPSVLGVPRVPGVPGAGGSWSWSLPAFSGSSSFVVGEATAAAASLPAPKRKSDNKPRRCGSGGGGAGSTAPSSPCARVRGPGHCEFFSGRFSGGEGEEEEKAEGVDIEIRDCFDVGLSRMVALPRFLLRAPSPRPSRAECVQVHYEQASRDQGEGGVRGDSRLLSCLALTSSTNSQVKLVNGDAMAAGVARGALRRLAGCALQIPSAASVEWGARRRRAKTAGGENNDAFLLTTNIVFFRVNRLASLSAHGTLRCALLLASRLGTTATSVHGTLRRSDGAAPAQGVLRVRRAAGLGQGERVPVGGSATLERVRVEWSILAHSPLQAGTWR